MAVDVRYLPGARDPGEILAQVRTIPQIDVERHFIHPPVTVSPTDPYARACADVLSRSMPDMETLSVGCDGASDVASFIEVVVESLRGAGHHGPDEWVSILSLARYRLALGSARCPRGADDEPGGGLTAIEGGLA